MIKRNSRARHEADERDALRYDDVIWPSFDAWPSPPDFGAAGVQQAAGDIAVVAKLEAALAATGEVPLPALVPADPLYGNQWHLAGTYGVNVRSVWDEYAGRGVLLGIVDDGVHYSHRDLDGNYRTDLDYDARNRDFDAFSSQRNDKHGTTVAGVIAAEQGNGYGVVGLAWDSDITGFRMGYGSAGSTAQILDNMQRQVNVDVSNNSWGYGGFFYDNFNSSNFSAAGAAIQAAAANGRDGLGTVFVFAAGNERAQGQNVNYHDFQNSPYVIAAAATDANGDIASFSTPGAAVLVAAPGVSILTTDRPGGQGYVSGDFVSVSGTSFSAPIVSGVVALMLEANPLLGYRDVQEILAYSAAKPPGFGANDQTNDAGNWNGGGLTVSHDYGFGLVDAHAAVRLAETWTAQTTFANLRTYTEGGSGGAIPDGNASGLSRTITVDATDLPTDIVIDRVEIALNITHPWIGDLVVTLTGPGGTTSTLVDRPGVTSSAIWGSSQDNIVFTMDSVQFWGEATRGTWTLTVTDPAINDVGTLNAWSLSFLGDYATANDSYFFTDQYGSYGGDATRRLLNDTDGGTDTINLCAVSTPATLDLGPGASSSIAGNGLAIGLGTVIENAYLGDGADTVHGNSADNLISGGRGGDFLWGAGGNDRFDYDRLADAGDTIYDFSAGDVLDLRDLLTDAGAAEIWDQSLVDAGGEASASDVAVRVDPDGAATAYSFTTIATVLDYGILLTVGTEIIV